MTIELPKPVAAYFAADSVDAEAFAACFAEDAVVKDEGHAHVGRAAIRKWKADASAKYRYTTEPLACERTDGGAVVTARVAGDFPGSPADLRFFFGLDGERIASLEVTA